MFERNYHSLFDQVKTLHERIYGAFWYFWFLDVAFGSQLIHKRVDHRCTREKHRASDVVFYRYLCRSCQNFIGKIHIDGRMCIHPSFCIHEMGQLGTTHTGLDFVGFSVSDRRARLMDCSQRTIQGSKVYFTNSRDCCSILEKMRHQSLSEDKVRHFWIWLIVNQSIQRMLDCLFFTTGVSILINMDRQSCNGPRKNPDAGIDCSHLHGTSFIDGQLILMQELKKLLSLHQQEMTYQQLYSE